MSRNFVLQVASMFLVSGFCYTEQMLAQTAEYPTCAEDEYVKVTYAY